MDIEYIFDYKKIFGLLNEFENTCFFMHKDLEERGSLSQEQLEYLFEFYDCLSELNRMIKREFSYLYVIPPTELDISQAKKN